MQLFFRICAASLINKMERNTNLFVDSKGSALDTFSDRHVFYFKYSQVIRNNLPLD